MTTETRLVTCGKCDERFERHVLHKCVERCACGCSHPFGRPVFEREDGRRYATRGCLSRKVFEART